MKYKSILFASSLFFLILSCNKREIDNSKQNQTKIESFESRVRQAKTESKVWYDNAIHKIKENQNKKKNIDLLSTTINTTHSEIDLVNDTAFVGLLYETINSNLNTYSYYLNQVGDDNFQDFVTTLTSNGIDPVVTFNNYNLQVDTFINNMTIIFAQAAMTIQNNPEFNNLPADQQDIVLQNAINYYFPSNEYQYAIPPSGIQVSGLLEEISGCLFDAVGGYLIGNARLIRDIYNAINGSSLGYQFIYTMSSRIIKQSFTNAGGWFGIAAGFAWCMIF